MSRERRGRLDGTQGRTGGPEEQHRSGRLLRFYDRATQARDKYLSHPHTHATNVAAFVPFVVEGTDVRRSWEPARVRRADKQRGRGRFHTWALNCWRRVPRADSVDQAPGEASRSRRRKGDLDYFLTVLALTCRQNLFRAPRAGYHFRNGGGAGFVSGAEGCRSSGGGAMGRTCFLHLTFARVGPRAPNQGRCDLVLLTGSQSPPPPWGSRAGSQTERLTPVLWNPQGCHGRARGPASCFPSPSPRPTPPSTTFKVLL